MQRQMSSNMPSEKPGREEEEVNVDVHIFAQEQSEENSEQKDKLEQVKVSLEIKQDLSSRKMLGDHVVGEENK